MLYEILVLIATFLFFLSIYFRYRRFGRLLAKIPGPFPLPIIGNTFDISLSREFYKVPVDTALIFTEELFKFCRRAYSDYGGRIFRIYGFHMGAVNIYDPEDVKTILSQSKFNEKLQLYNFLEPWLGKGLLTSGGSKWHHRRKLLTPAFHFNILRRFTTTFTEHVEELLRLVQHQVGQPRTDLRPLISQATLKIICETSMGYRKEEDISSEADNYFQGLTTISNCLIERTTKVWFYPDPIYFLSQTYRKQTKALHHLHSFTKQVIQKRRIAIQNNEIENDGKDDHENSKGKTVLLDLLLEQEKEGNIDEEGIREEVDTFMFEGHDTTSTSVCFMIMRIANEPAVQDLIYEEMLSIFGESDRSPTIEDLGEMKYLERCIKESLRLYPGVPYIARHLYEDVVFNGYTIPAGTEINIHIYDIHRNKEVYPDPERFDPDRFLPEQVAQRHPYAYIPFSAGPRNCIGQKFAMLEIKTMVSGLVRRFRLEPVTKPQDIVFESYLVLKAKDPIYVKFCNRK